MIIMYQEELSNINSNTVGQTREIQSLESFNTISLLTWNAPDLFLL